ncbi:MAG: proteasome subunit beta [Streptosporangiaceae bacterium]|nr:proteasome subunit beta [Streptosporangiaceae bacterium]
MSVQAVLAHEGTDPESPLYHGRRSALGSYFDGSQPGPFTGGTLGAGNAGQPRPGAGFLGRQTSSFAEFLASYSPELLPGRGAGPVPGFPADGTGTAPSQVIRDLPHATTIVAAACEHGVVIAGDRRATAGSMIAKRDVQKVFRSDEYSAIGYAGTGSAGIEYVRLFQVELEHYDKMEGRSLSLEGKANRLASMIRANLAMAMQGLVVVPLFVGYDEATGQGRIFSYDVVGGPYEEKDFYSIGSGSVFARGSLKKLYTENMPVRDAVLVCVQALYDAADDDSATGGPDLPRRIFPVIATVTADGFRKLPEAESGETAQQVVQERMARPDGPAAELRAPS